MNGLAFKTVKKIIKLMSFCIPSKEGRSKFRLWAIKFFDKERLYEYNVLHHRFSYDEVGELLEARKYYPRNILSAEATVEKLINEKISLSRLGDGEEFAYNLMNDKPLFPLLKQKLYNICAHGSDDKCLVCINNFNADSDAIPVHYRNAFIYYFACCYSIRRILDNIKFNKATDYGDAYALLFNFKDEDSLETKRAKLERIKKIWEGRKVLFVVNSEAGIINDKSVFENVAEKAYVFAPGRNAFSDYERIMNEITEGYDTTWLVYIAAGACATVLSFELSRKGYQALDMGFFYDRVGAPISALK